jgi:hypothetical protein
MNLYPGVTWTDKAKAMLMSECEVAKRALAQTDEVDPMHP